MFSPGKHSRKGNIMREVRAKRQGQYGRQSQHEIQGRSSVQNRYVYGSAAEKIQRELYEAQVKGIKEKQQKQQSFRYKAKFLMVNFVVFACLITITVLYAEITKVGYETNSIIKEYEKVKNENSLMHIKINSAMSLDNILNKAKNELFMINPERKDIVYIDVPDLDLDND